MKCALKREVNKIKFSRYVLSVERLSTYTHYPLSQDLHFTSRGVRPQIMRKNQIEIYGMRSEVIETAATANGVKMHTMDTCRSFLSISCASNFLSINHQKNIPLAYIDHAMVASYSPSSIILLFLHINEHLRNFID